jgi:predicted NBD/HSP70 family sugar kinase
MVLIVGVGGDNFSFRPETQFISQSFREWNAVVQVPFSFKWCLTQGRALIRALQKAGVASRAGLARSLGMSQPTAGKIVDELLALNVLEEVETPSVNGASARLGRPGRQLQLNRSQPSFLGIQLGICETQVAELALGATDTDEWQASFQNPSGQQANPVADWARQLKAVARKLGSKPYLGVVLSVPGVVDEAASRILFSPNIHWTENADLPAIIQRVWNVPVLLVQEERALALGHHVNHPEQEDFLLVDFGEGVGGAVIVGGKPLASPLPICGEIGHTPVLGNQRKCGCGAVGCMETLVSVRGLLKSFAEAGGWGSHSWSGLREEVVRRGLPPWLAGTLDAAAIPIAASLNVLGLRRVVITGSLGELPPTVLDHLSLAIRSGTMWARFGSVECTGERRQRLSGLVATGIDRFIVPERPAN